jgi:hypothetical protein
MFKFLSCAKRPVGIAQKFTGQENEVSLPGTDDVIRLCR